jgi:molecular chaperone GrpE
MASIFNKNNDESEKTNNVDINHCQDTVNKEDQQQAVPSSSMEHEISNLSQDELKNKIIEIFNQKEQLIKDNNKLLLALADKENELKRNAKHVENLKKYFAEDIAKEIIQIKDNLILASEDKGVDEDAFKRIKDVINLTSSQISHFFQRFNITEVDAQPGQQFDYSKHYAVKQEERDGFEPDSIIEVIQKGYNIQDRLLRPALVIVCTKQ